MWLGMAAQDFKWFPFWDYNASALAGRRPMLRTAKTSP